MPEMKGRPEHSQVFLELAKLDNKIEKGACSYYYIASSLCNEQALSHFIYC